MSSPQALGKWVISQVEMMGRQMGSELHRQSSGFTLLELVLATLISALVIGIFSLALSISLRAWERQQNREPSDVPSLLNLLKWQLAQFEPIVIELEGKKHSIFEGTEHSLAFATDYSVRAISKGVPVVARYVFVPGRGELYYAELPLDPYHPEAINGFLQMGLSAAKSWPHFYLTEIAQFSLSYAGEELQTLSPQVDGTSGLPVAVVVSCASKQEPELFSAMMFINSPFNKVTVQSNTGKTVLPTQRIRRQTR
jgi:hypothetical protein